jgi:hypothetical protein
MEFLSRRGIAFEAKDISTDQGALAALNTLGVHSTPTIVVDDQVMEGFRSDKLLEMLEG